MEEKKIVISKPISVAGLTLILVAKISTNLWSTRAGEAFLAIKQPLAIIVVSPQAKRAYRITGEEVSLDELIQEVPELKDI
jgi:hypothetical protein